MGNTPRCWTKRPRQSFGIGGGAFGVRRSALGLGVRTLTPNAERPLRDKLADVRSIKTEIEERVRLALARVAGAEGERADPLVRPTQDPGFGDYQSNAALALAKQVGRKPRELAEAIIASLSIDDACAPPEIA